MTYAIYCRKSKFTGAGESIENQAALCRAYLKNRCGSLNEAELLLYEDEGYSGKNLDRPQFRRLLRDADARRIDCVVCYRLDRISRSVVDFSSLVERFGGLGIGLVCVREQFDTATPMGRAMMYIASVFAQLERETIAERVRDNLLLLAGEGRWLGGTTPYGFCSRRQEKTAPDGRKRTFCQLENDPVEEETVRLIFRLFLEKGSLAALEEALDGRGAVNRRGMPFSLPGLRALLKNPVYAAADREVCRYFAEHGAALAFTPDGGGGGLLCYQKRTGRSGGEHPCPPGEWIVAKGTHRGVVSGRDWVRVQELLAARARPDRKPAAPYALLAGLLTCGVCGARMYPKRRSGRPGDYDYICASKLRGAECRCPNLNGREADARVRAAFSARLLLPKILRRGEKAERFPPPEQWFDLLPLPKQQEVLRAVLTRIERIPDGLRLVGPAENAGLFPDVSVSLLKKAASRRSLQ